MTGRRVPRGRTSRGPQRPRREKHEAFIEEETEGNPHVTSRAGPISAREIAAAVVGRVLDDGAFVAGALSGALDRSALDSRDRALCTELVYGTLRWAVPLEASLLRGADKPGRGLDKRLRPHLLVAAYQLQHLDERVPAHAAVSEAMKAIAKVRPGLKGFANALLRKLGSPSHVLLSPDATLKEVARAYGIPPALARVTAGTLKGEAQREAIAALNARPPLSLVVLDDDVEEICKALEKAGAELSPHPFVPRVFLANGAGSPEKLPGFKEGSFVVQDPGSRLVALLANTPRGSRVLDLCAAPGTKTVGLARATGIRGSVLALDIDDRRLALLDDSAKRAAPLPAAPILAENIDARLFCSNEANHGEFDVVLLDAPCSSLGTTRRHPEVCIRRSEDDVIANSKLQAELLSAAAHVVRPGGALIYAVCSPMPAEGRDQVHTFLEANPDFSIASAGDCLEYLPASTVDADGALQLVPHLHAADAFYAVRLVRNNLDQ